jgi:hypothetical protein
MSYTFNTKIEAENFIDRINKGEGIPRPFDSVTLSYCLPEPIYDVDDSDVLIEERTIIGWSVIQDEITYKYYL